MMTMMTIGSDFRPLLKRSKESLDHLVSSFWSLSPGPPLPECPRVPEMVAKSEQRRHCVPSKETKGRCQNFKTLVSTLVAHQP